MLQCKGPTWETLLQGCQQHWYPDGHGMAQGWECTDQTELLQPATASSEARLSHMMNGGP